MHKFPHRLFVLVAVVALLIPTVASASNAWSTYHWARTSNPFTLKVHDNVTLKWEASLFDADKDWDLSTELDLNVLWQQPLSNVKKCASATGVIEICNSRYGATGWLGIAGISVSGSHITKGYTKLNDTYFDTATYNKPEWRQMVTCQELGHDFGLAHQDEVFDNPNLGSCMDYTNNPLGPPSNVSPNTHDFDQIKAIYAHLDSTTTISSVIGNMAKGLSRPQTIGEILADAGQWGTPVRFDGEGRPNVFILVTGMSKNGEAEFEVTHILWAPFGRAVGNDE